jgi:CheY-like chemotaxis protein
LIKAQSGAEALALLPQHPDIALVLLDVQMPGMDGFEVARHIKETPQFRGVPILFITAIHTEDPFVRRGYQAGAIDYFSKPFDPDVLRLKVGIYAASRQRAQLLAIKEQQLKDSEELLRAGRKLAGRLESLPVGVIIADDDDRVVQINDEVLEILKPIEPLDADGYGEFIGWWEHEGRELKAVGGPLAKAIAGLVSRNRIIEIKRLDGSWWRS